MLASNGAEDVDKPIYDNSIDWESLPGYVNTEIAIQNPFTFYYKSMNDWSSSHNYDYWNINFTGAAGVNNTATEKTVYDPSVSGFTLPRTAAFTGFTTTGNNTSNSSEFNVSGSWDNGLIFFTGVGSNTISFEAFGYRETYNGATGYVSGNGTEGIFWQSGASSVSFARNLDFVPDRVYPQHVYNRSYGFSVRPVSEDNSN